MRKILAVIAFAAINWSALPASASDCTLFKDIDASRLRWSKLRNQPASTTGSEKACRAYATSFYEAVTLRQSAATCLNLEQNLALLDSEINAFNDLLAEKCVN